MQIYQKNGVTGKLCQRISVTGSVLLLRSIFIASVFTCKFNSNSMTFRTLTALIIYPFSIFYTFNFFHNLLLS